MKKRKPKRVGVAITVDRLLMAIRAYRQNHAKGPLIEDLATSLGTTPRRVSMAIEAARRMGAVQGVGRSLNLRFEAQEKRSELLKRIAAFMRMNEDGSASVLLPPEIAKDLAEFH